MWIPDADRIEALGMWLDELRIKMEVWILDTKKLLNKEIPKMKLDISE